VRITLASDISAAAMRAYGRHVGGSPKATDAFGRAIAAAATTKVLGRALAAAAKAPAWPRVAMPIDRADD